MAKKNEQLNALLDRDYEHGFVTDIEVETFAPGLDEDVIRRLSAIKGEPEFLLAWRLQAYRYWLTLTPPEWSSVHYPPIDYQALSYYSAFYLFVPGCWAMPAGTMAPIAWNAETSCFTCPLHTHC